MGERWFQSLGIVKYRSLTSRARALSAAANLGMVFFVVGCFFFTSTESNGWWWTGMLGFAAAVIGHGLISWKMDWGDDGADRIDPDNPEE